MIEFKRVYVYNSEFRKESNVRFNKEIKSPKDLLINMGVDRVIFNDDATIVYLNTGEKGVAKRAVDDEFDPVVGFCVAYAMAEGTSGNKKQFKNLVNKLYNKKNFKV